MAVVLETVALRGDGSWRERNQQDDEKSQAWPPQVKREMGE
jgi:hypothetical protein